MRPVSGYYSHLIGAFVFGITQGILFKRYLFLSHGKSNPVKPRNIEEKPKDYQPANTQCSRDENGEEPPIEDKPIYDLNKLLK